MPSHRLTAASSSGPNSKKLRNNKRKTTVVNRELKMLQMDLVNWSSPVLLPNRPSRLNNKTPAIPITINLIVGEFRVMKKLGEGDNADCFVGQKKAPSTKFALKFQEYRNEKSKIIDNELKMLKRAQGHPSILEYFEHFKFDEYKVIVTKLLYCDLNSQLEIVKRLCSHNTLRIGHELFVGLDWLRENGIVHRDLHGGNVFFDKKFSKTVIGDFGCAEMEKRNDLNLKFRDLSHISHRVNEGNEYCFLDDTISVVFLLLKLCGDQNLFTHQNLEKMVEKKKKLFEKPRAVLRKQSNKFIIPIIEEVKSQLVAPQPTHRQLLTVIVERTIPEFDTNHSSQRFFDFPQIESNGTTGEMPVKTSIATKQTDPKVGVRRSRRLTGAFTCEDSNDLRTNRQNSETSDKENLTSRQRRTSQRNLNKPSEAQKNKDKDTEFDNTVHFGFTKDQKVGKYTIEKRLGGGDNAECYAARKKYARATVALKFIKFNKKSSKLIDNEMKMLTKAQKHDFVQVFYGSFKYEKFHVIVLQQLHCDLRSQLKHPKTLFRQNVGKVAYQTIQGLEWLGSKNIIHRDLHCGNIFLTKNFSNIVIGDFGCAEMERRNDLKLRFNDLDHISHRVNKGAEYRFIDDIVSVVFLMLTLIGDSNLFSDENLPRMVQKKEKLFNHPENVLTKPSNEFLIPIIIEVQSQLDAKHSYPALLDVFRRIPGFSPLNKYITSSAPVKHLR